MLYFIGTGLYYGVIRRVADRDMFISLLATFGLSILLQQLMNQIWAAMSGRPSRASARGSFSTTR